MTEQDKERVPGASEHDDRYFTFEGAADRDASELQPDLQLTEGPASRGRIWSYAAVIVLILAAVFYGLHNANRQTASNPPPLAQTSQSAPSQGGPNHNGVNTQSGVTTGSAPDHATPPESRATGPEIDRAAQPSSTGQSK
jgi:hypothetical protein